MVDYKITVHIINTTINKSLTIIAREVCRLSYYIGSFNLRDFNFSNTSSDGSQEKLKRNFEKIAKIIIDEKFDVVALQEVNAPLPLEYLTRILNTHKTPVREYDFRFGSDLPHKKCTSDPERYGFIWNTKRLRLIKPRRGSNPGYYENAGALGLIRPPYYGRFTARGMLGGSNLEFRIINTHIHYGSGKEDRMRELGVLVKQILPRICDHQEISEDGETMPAYTFLMGDYNLELNQGVGERAIYRIETITTTNYTGKNREYRTVQNKATSLKLPNNQTSIEDCYASNYDHFTYEVDLDTKLVLVPQRIETLSKYYSSAGEPADKLRKYRSEVSDHVPIKMTVDFK